MRMMKGHSRRHWPAPGATLASRLGLIVAISPLRYWLQTLMSRHPSGAALLEDWLLDVANARGANFIVRVPPRDPAFVSPDRTELSNEDLVCAICHLQNADRPQMLRAAAQLVSKGAVDPDRLAFSAKRERVEVVLAELARLALRVDASHVVWRAVQGRLGTAPPPRSPLLHWTRMAVPVPDERGCNARTWKLIA